MVNTEKDGAGFELGWWQGKDGSGEDTEFAAESSQGSGLRGKRSSQDAADTGGESCGPFPRGLQEVKPVKCLETER